MSDGRSPVRFLLIPGSSRAGSTNVAVLRTVVAEAPRGVVADMYDGIGSLPLFNPDDDREGEAVDDRVAAMRAAVARADAILICTPEYAGASPSHCARFSATPAPRSWRAHVRACRSAAT